MAEKPEKAEVLRFHVRDVRLAFPNLDKPGKFGYGCRFLLPPDHTQTLNPMSVKYCQAMGVKLPDGFKTNETKVKTVAVLKAIGKAVARKKWDAKGDSIFTALEKQDKIFLHDGDTKADLDGFEGNLFIACGSRGPVPMYDQLRNDATAREVYSGAWVVGSIDVWAQDNEDGGKRLNATVYGVQKLRDGDAFASGGPPAEAGEFDEIAVEDDEGSGDESDPSDDDDLTA